MREIPLTQGKVALVDDGDYPEISKFKWYAHKDGKTWYALRSSPRDACGKQYKIMMHRTIFKICDGLEIDHINGNGLDNRCENLQAVTTRGNAQNRHQLKSSKYPGVTWREYHQKWSAQISLNGRVRHIGYFSDEVSAFVAYENACSSLFVPSRKVSSKFKGVTWHRRGKVWQVQIRGYNKKRYYLGSYKDEETAGIVYAVAQNTLKGSCKL